MPYECDGEVDDTPWMIGLTGGGFRTTVNLDDIAVDLEESNGTLSVGYHFNTRWGVTGGVGMIFGGTATIEDGDGGDIGRGLLVSASGSYLAMFEKPRRPFLLLTLSGGVSTTTAVADDGARRRLTAGDVRLAALVGKTFGRLVPFASVRAFGGPVFWRIGGARVSGGDAHHYAVGAGLTVRLPARLDLIAEVMPLGEQSATAGVTYRF